MNPDSNDTNGSPDPTPPDWSSAATRSVPGTPDGAAPPTAPPPRDVASILAFVLSLVGAVVIAVPLAVLGARRTRAGARRGRGLALSAFGVSAAWVVAGVALSTSGILGAPDPMAASELVEPVAPSRVTAPTPTTTAPTPGTPSATPSAAQKPLAKPKKVYWQSLKPGMCVRDTAESVTNIPVVDCRAPHQFEVTARTKTSGPNKWPGDDKITDLVEGKCRAAFERYVGLGYDQSDLDMDFWTADEEGWAAGNRTLICFVYDPSNETTAQTLAAAAR